MVIGETWGSLSSTTNLNSGLQKQSEKNRRKRGCFCGTAKTTPSTLFKRSSGTVTRQAKQQHTNNSSHQRQKSYTGR